MLALGGKLPSGQLQGPGSTDCILPSRITEIPRRIVHAQDLNQPNYHGGSADRQDVELTYGPHHMVGMEELMGEDGNFEEYGAHENQIRHCACCGEEINVGNCNVLEDSEVDLQP